MFFSLTKKRETVQDRSALFESLMRSSQKQAFAYAHRLTGNSHEAEDLVQESYVRAFKFFHRFDESLPFTSWLFRIMTNAHIDMMRRKGRIKTTSLESKGEDGNTAWELPDESLSPDRDLISNSLEDAVQNGLQKMNPEFRTAVILSDLEGMAYEEVAVVMNTSVGTVRSRIHRGRKMLRSYLKIHAPEMYGRFAEDEL